jgi:hypothetical protein
MTWCKRAEAEQKLLQEPVMVSVQEVVQGAEDKVYTSFW